MSGVRGLPPAQAGYSLVEVLIAVSLMGLTIIPVMALMTQSLLVTDRSSQMVEMASAARNLLEEIRSKSFEDSRQPGFGTEPDDWDGNGFPDEDPLDRRTFDDVDDYCGWSGAPQDPAGNPIPALQHIRLEVLVWYVDDTDQDGFSDTDGPTGNDNGAIVFNYAQDPPVRIPPQTPCTLPDSATRFKLVQITASSRKYGEVDPRRRNARPTVVRTVVFQ